MLLQKVLSVQVENIHILFDTLLETKILIERWKNEYNHIRPHSSLNYCPPAPEVYEYK